MSLLPADWADEFSVDYSSVKHRLSWVAGMAFAPNGEIVVLDREERTLAVWSAGGIKLRQLAGPKSLDSPRAICVSDSSLVAVSDGSKVIVYALEGGVHGDFRLPDLTFALQPSFDACGRVAVLSMNLLAYVSEQGVLRIIRLADDKTLWSKNAMVLASCLYAPRPVFAQLWDGHVLVGVDHRYRLDVVNLDSGMAVGRIARDVFMRRIESEFRAKARRYLLCPDGAPEGWRVYPPGTKSDSVTLTRAEVEEIEFADVFPAVVHAFRGPPGETIWVRRGLGVGDEAAPPLEPPDAIPMWDLFSGRTREYLGAVRLPKGFVAYAGDSTRLAGVQTDPEGTQHFRVARVSV